jgi:hypothetical protein
MKIHCRDQDGLEPTIPGFRGRQPYPFPISPLKFTSMWLCPWNFPLVSDCICACQNHLRLWQNYSCQWQKYSCMWQNYSYLWQNYSCLWQSNSCTWQYLSYLWQNYSWMWLKYSCMWQNNSFLWQNYSCPWQNNTCMWQNYYVYVTKILVPVT